MFEAFKVGWLLKALGDLEEPLGVYYSDLRPDEGAGTKAGPKHDCLMKYVRLARVKRKPGWVDRQNPGCLGGSVYCGFKLPVPEIIHHHVTTGLPGQEGERYLPAPKSMVRFIEDLDLWPAPADYCIFKPLQQFTAAEEPLAVIFFARGEALTGLCQLAYFSLDDHQAVAFPFGSGCANLLAWPFYYDRHQLDKAVVGGADPSCRPFLETDELTFTVSAKVLAKMLEAGPNSFLTTPSWAKVLKKIALSQRRWSRQ